LHIKGEVLVETTLHYHACFKEWERSFILLIVVFDINLLCLNFDHFTELMIKHALLKLLV